MATIECEEKELKIFNTLLNTLRYCNLNDTNLRVAGGWVRDKLLGKDSNDIDIAIDNMFGSAFCDKVEEYLSSIGEQVRKGGTIKSNPDKSKHLESAKTKIHDQVIDFVNLRCEEYAANSRIPTTMKFGTAEQDAFRRDLTINSLFYNIHNGSVEDFTGKGIKDLKSGVIATPLPAKVTFLDDPLRVLRAIRFGARFGFTLDEDVKQAASSEKVRKALGEKISRERIGEEIDLMITGNRPASAIAYLSELKLFDVVFALPPLLSEPTPSGNCSSLSHAYLEAMWNLLQSPRLGTFSREQRRLALYAALFLPLRNTVYKEKKGKDNNDKSATAVVNHIFKFSLKGKNSDAKTVINIHGTTDRFLSLIRAILLKDEVKIDIFEVPATSKVRVFAGLLLRDSKDWRVSLLTSLLLLDQEIGQLDKILEIYLTIEDTIKELGLENIWHAKHLVNGHEIMEITGLKGGRLIEEWKDKVMKWQLAYPKGSEEECKNWLREMKAKRQRTE